MRHAILDVAHAVSAISAAPAHAATITGDQSATGAAPDIATEPRTGRLGRVLCAQFATVVALVKTTASQPATTVAPSPLGLGSDDGSVPACRGHFTHTSLAKKALV